MEPHSRLYLRLASGEARYIAPLAGCSSLLLAQQSLLPQAVATYLDLGFPECDVALEAAMQSDDEDLDWLY